MLPQDTPDVNSFFAKKRKILYVPKPPLIPFILQNGFQREANVVNWMQRNAARKGPGEERGMTRILFVCHGNICRSPMAESVMKELVRRCGQEGGFFIDSAATSTEEIGNPVHSGTRRKLAQVGIPCAEHRARQLRREDYSGFDLLIGMDDANLRNMRRMLGGDPEGKIHALLDYAGRPGQSIADPWYTGDFQATYEDVLAGCQGLLEQLSAQ